MSPIKRAFRRIPFVRFCALEYARKERKRLADIRWKFRYSAFASVGYIAHTWAGIEAILDALIDWYHPIAGRENIQTEVPVGLSGKLSYMNKMSRDPGFNDPAKETLLLFKREAKRLGKIRALIVHGMMFRDPGTPTGWHLQVREFDKETSKVVTHHFDNDTLIETQRQMTGFLSALSPWALKIISGNRDG